MKIIYKKGKVPEKDSLPQNKEKLAFKTVLAYLLVIIQFNSRMLAKKILQEIKNFPRETGLLNLKGEFEYEINPNGKSLIVKRNKKKGTVNDLEKLFVEIKTLLKKKKIKIKDKEIINYAKILSRKSGVKFFH